MPPTLRELLSDPVFRMYYLRAPRLPENMAWGDPWMVWAVSHENRWGSRLFSDYREAWAKTVEIYKQPDRFRDVAIVSRRVMYAPPPKAVWPSRLSWCCRCRRPSEFRIRSTDHHALRGKDIVAPNAMFAKDKEKRRCYYCGIREMGMPQYTPEY